MDADQVLAFRLARAGLAVRETRTLAGAAACPASDFTRDAALLALAARVEDVSREAYHHAVDAGEIGVAHVIRGAIHALAPEAFPPLGRALIARDDDELSRQLGEQVRRLRREELRDPYLQQPNRALLTPGAELRKRLFRPVASPGAILTDGRLAGLWRVKAKGRKAEVTVERLGGRVPRADLEHEAQRVARLRGAAEALLVDA